LYITTVQCSSTEFKTTLAVLINGLGATPSPCPPPYLPAVYHFNKMTTSPTFAFFSSFLFFHGLKKIKEKEREKRKETVRIGTKDFERSYN
jgi:hypothetical protein